MAGDFMPNAPMLCGCTLEDCRLNGCMALRRVTPGDPEFRPTAAPPILQGWECPKCLIVHAPWVQTCPTCVASAIVAPDDPRAFENGTRPVLPGHTSESRS